MRIKYFTLLIIIILIFLLTLDVEAGVSLSPAKLVIEMKEFPRENIGYPIRITNPYNFDITVSIKIIHPFNMEFTNGYSKIPSLSWVRPSFEKTIIPAKSYKDIDIVVDIPDNEKPYHYNESWEVWALVTPSMSKNYKGENFSSKLQIQLAAKILINTPEGVSKEKIVQSMSIFLMTIVLVFLITWLILSFKKNPHMGRKRQK